jgi:hypothetical protein
MSVSKDEDWNRISEYLERMKTDDKEFYNHANEVIIKMKDVSEWIYPYGENGGLKRGYQLYWNLAAALEISGKARSYLKEAERLSKDANR